MTDDGGRDDATTGRRHPLDLKEMISEDRQLQRELTAALEQVADSLPQFDPPLLRVIQAVLEPSWQEHVSFQNEALFPIVKRIGAPPAEIQAMLDQLSAEHLALSEHQANAGRQIAKLMRGRISDFEVFGKEMREVFDLRQRHLDREAQLELWLPLRMDPLAHQVIDAWLRSRPSPRFPASLILDWEI